MNKIQPKISIITVCYNAQDFIEETIVSVINQNYPNMEYIIIDGGSKDATLSIIEKYRQKIDYLISEKDNGVFDAMNKGIRASNGEWLNFMNAGDFFVDNNVLKNINFDLYKQDALIYGKSITNDTERKIFKTESLHYGYIPACHQAMFFNRSVTGSELYYTSEFLLLNDYELVNRLYLKKYTFSVLNLLIANYAPDGISSKISWKARKARYVILFRSYGILGLFRGILERLRIIKIMDKLALIQ